jgi:uncharacterized membrane protein
MWVSGLFAVNRPWSASVAYLSGVITTVVGLALFLRSGGIMAAAWVSTVTYVQVFVVALWMYKRAARLTWAQFVPVRTWFHVNE